MYQIHLNNLSFFCVLGQNIAIDQCFCQTVAAAPQLLIYGVTYGEYSLTCPGSEKDNITVKLCFCVGIQTLYCLRENSPKEKGCLTRVYTYVNGFLLFRWLEYVLLLLVPDYRSVPHTTQHQKTQTISLKSWHLSTSVYVILKCM